MKGLIVLLACLTFAAGQENKPKITAEKNANVATLKCDGGTWAEGVKNEINLSVDRLETVTCETGNKNQKAVVFIKVRTCDNCIELDVWTLTAIIIGNILMTILIGVVVYKLTAQPTAKTFSGNKASDRQNLIQNGERDTYQRLNAGQKSEYSALGVGKRS
ncbi:T-cell surface glycoprotein CD3 delta chain-like [Salminus brasiliensis]|uniref:T-cell surface glycoprotein CD3 delta chain-like n=1 Tax=Salminus brasiliensis TaxID=930266 RepID=UPI003B8344BE